MKKKTIQKETLRLLKTIDVKLTTIMNKGGFDLRMINFLEKDIEEQIYGKKEGK